MTTIASNSGEANRFRCTKVLAMSRKRMKEYYEVKNIYCNF